MRDSAIHGSLRGAPQFAIASGEAPKFPSGASGLGLQLPGASSPRDFTPPLNDLASNFVDVGQTNGEQGATS